MNPDDEKVPERHEARRRSDPTRIADATLVERVRAAGAESAEYRYLKEALEEIAVGSMTNLEKKRGLHAAIMRQGCVLRRPIPLTYPANFRTILHLAVWTASPKFMTKQIIGGGWQSEGKASVRTFFVSAAMFEFAAEYNRFWHEEHPRLEKVTVGIDETVPDEAYYMTARFGADPEERAENRDRISRIVNDYVLASGSDPRLGTIIVRTAQQYTQPEIAEELGISPEAVSSAIRRLRRRLS